MNKTKLKKFVKEISLPLIALLLYLVLFKFQKVISLPSQSNYLDLIRSFVNNQSLLWIFLIALVEGGLILGQYSPGGLVIFLTILSAGNNLMRVAAIVIVITCAFTIAYSFDYFLGYYGLNRLGEKFGLKKYLSKAQRILTKNEFNAIFFSYWDNNLASITATASGTLKIPYKKFITYSIGSILFWNIFWATMLVLFGNAALVFFGPKYLLLIIIVWALFVVYRNFVRKPEVNTNL